MLNWKQQSDQAKRLAEIVRVFARYGLADWFKGISNQTILDLLASQEAQALGAVPAAERLRRALTELGPTFIKLGQVLSTRADLVGPEVADELRKLQSNTPADSPDVVRQTIRDEFGKEPEELFSEFEAEAFASASIGQVHRARLPDGQEVVVKVQHAGIQDKVRLDLELLQDLAKLLEQYVAEARLYQPVATTREFARTLQRELDFTFERRNVEQFTRNFDGDSTIHLPIVYPDRCGRRVLTMELLKGIPGSKPEKISASGVDLNGFANAAANVFLNMIFRDGFYHADPHPGNFMILEGGVLGLLDCGMVGRIDEPMREQFEDLLLLLLQGDSAGLSDLLLRLGSAPRDVDRVGFQADISDLLMDVGAVSLQDLDVSAALEQISDILRRYHIVMPSRVALLLKTLVMLEGSSRLLSPSFSLAELLEPLKERLIRERMDPRRLLRKLLRPIRDLDRLVTQTPRNLADILDNLQSGNLSIKHEVENLEVIVNRSIAGLLIAALFTGSSMLLSSGFPPLVSDVSVFGVLGCLSAAVLGGRFLWAVRKDLK